MHIDQVAWVPTSSLGLFGVLLFFVHTSLVLMYSIERSDLTGWRLFKNFQIRRVFRIYPLSVIAVAAALLLHLDSGVNGIPGLSYSPLPGKREILANFLLVQNLAEVKSTVNVLWSLPFELQMYLLLPFLFLWVRRKPRIWLLLSLWAVGVVAALVQPHVEALRKLSLLLFVPNFLPGVIAYCIPRRPLIKSFLWPLLILAVVTAFTVYPHLPLSWGLCLILGLLIPLFAEISTQWVRWLSNRIATYSYGIYLSHQFCIWIAFGLLAQRSPWLRVPLFALLLVGIPILLYHAIEKPMIRVGIQIANKWSAPRIAGIEAVAAS
jgi:peptidoglycan/LPS O-acetylase OafA/YrhL